MKIKKRKIELLLAEKGLGCQEVAKNAQIHPQVLSVVMHRGTCRPATAGKIARALGVDPEEIVDNE